MSKKHIALFLLSGLVLGTLHARGADRLRGEQSAFLKEFAESPVDWMPWGDAAIARAKAEKMPVFVFVGSFTSELSGAMRRQTFANPKTSDWLNKHFVCVVVDRDERPDVAALYEAYVVNLKQLNGWPLNIWLTPDFQPFEGATYLSPSEDWGAPGFLKLANQAMTAWTNDPAGCMRRAKEALSQLAPPPAPTAQPDPSLELSRSRLAAAAAAWRATFDAAKGGYGDLPKSPEPELIRFMLLGSDEDRGSAAITLRALAVSAVRDPLDGGFFRHAADGAWHIPYQQKTLSDQARIALAFLAGAQGDDQKSFLECARGALDFALTRLSTHGGLLASAEDATDEEFSGYYTWTAAELDKALGPDAKSFNEAHGVMPDGNIPVADDPSALYAHKNLLRSLAVTDEAQARLAARLLAVREKRGTPHRDERATVGAHGLVINALARAGLQLSNAHYYDEARRILAAVKENFLVSKDGTLRRFAGSDVPADAEDYAALALGCRGLARATGDKEADAFAELLLGQLDARFYDPATRTYLGAPKPPGPGFFIRPPSAGDPPAAEGLAILARSVNGRALAAALSASLAESSAQAPGDQLLALRTFEFRESRK
jgi:uncharacterized protein YyaL (SSP411 family)